MTLEQTVEQTIGMFIDFVQIALKFLGALNAALAAIRLAFGAQG